MSMIKVAPVIGDGTQSPIAQVKMASEGLSGTDLAELVKRAGHPLASWVRNNPPLPGEVYAHARSMGATEFVGPNRNHDGYTIGMLRRDIPTFEKNAYWFLNHQNGDPKRSYGKVKKAFLNEHTGMVDTITALNATKEAADRNGNLVAERTLHKMASGADVAVSQSCRVPMDVCISCGNKAKNRSQYCTAAMGCKYGGCRDNLGRVFDDGFHLYVDNPVCNFFDLSDVSDTRGADRTAFITGKVAASGRVVGGAELAEQLGLVPPEFILDPLVRSGIKMLRKLAKESLNRTDASAEWDVIVKVRNQGVQPDLNGATDAQRHQKVAHLGLEGVILPPHIWLSAVSGVSVEKCANVFIGGIDPLRNLLNRSDCTELLEDYTISGTPSLRHSLAPTVKSHIKEAQQTVLIGSTKVASTVVVDPQISDMAKARYLAYQVGILSVNENSADFGLLLSDAIRHGKYVN